MNWQVGQRSEVVALSWPGRTKIGVHVASSIWSQLGRLEGPLGGRILSCPSQNILGNQNGPLIDRCICDFFWMFSQHHCLQQTELIPMNSNMENQLMFRFSGLPGAPKKSMGAISWSTKIYNKYLSWKAICNSIAVLVIQFVVQVMQFLLVLIDLCFDPWVCSGSLG